MLPQENITGTVPTTVKLTPSFENRNIKIKKNSIHPKLQLFTYTSLRCFKQNERNRLDSNEICLKEKTFGKESKTSFTSFKSVNMLKMKRLC